MYKNVLLILVVTAFLWACGGQSTTSQDQTAVVEEEIVSAEPQVIALADFKTKAGSLVGQEVVLEGTVIHVCKHGGKKMFITADDPDVRIKITVDDETAAFDPELEGSNVKVLGIVEEIEVESSGEGQNAEEGEEHEEDDDHKNIYHVPQYSVSLIEYSVLEVVPE
jgi:hypothetical protein